MAEHRFENVPARRCAIVRRDLVADAACADFGFRCVAFVTVRMSLNTDRDRLSRAGGLMARNTALARKPFARVVRRVIELHVESLDKPRREFMYRRRDRIHVSMTDRAHRLLLRIRELTDMTPDARIVSCVFKILRRALATMTRGAFEFFMLRYLV